ncbi:DUF3800 domain-containing protein [Priestia sp. BR_2]
MNYSVYFDEYGNTGNNYLDLNQRYFILAGWIIPEPITDELRNNVMDAVRNYNKNLREIKGKKLLESHKGRVFLVAVLLKLIECGCKPIVSICDKSFVLAAKFAYLLDDCVDPKLLHKFNLIISAENRIKFAKLIQNKCKDELQEFGKLLRQPDTESLNNVFKKVRRKFARSKYSILFSENTVNINDAVESLNLELNSQPKKAASAINLSAFTSVLMLLEDIGRNYNVNFDVYCDEVLQFKIAFDNYSAYMKNDTDFHYTMDNGMTGWFDLKHTHYKGMLNSESEVLVQLADGFCSVLQALINFPEDTDIQNDLSIAGYLLLDETIQNSTIHYMMDKNKLVKLIKEWKKTAESSVP